MLALMKDGALVLDGSDKPITAQEGPRRLTLPNGATVSPLYDGWTSDDGYSLVTIAAADAVPDGKQIVSTTVELVEGVPTYVNTLEDVPDIIPSTPTLIATALIKLSDGDITAMSVSSLLAGAFRIDTGMYYVFFANPQPDTDYLALAYDSGTHRIYISEDDKATDYFIVNATDFTGTASDPASLSIEIKRVQ